MDSLREAATTTQVLLTTHSPDLLDRFDLEHDTLLVVQAEQGMAVIGPADSASRDAIRQHLYSAGELLRMDQLQADRSDVKRQTDLDFDAPVDEPGAKYSESIDQAKLTAHMDLSLCRTRAPSFDKLCRELERFA